MPKTQGDEELAIEPFWMVQGTSRGWVDQQNDVTAKDIKLAKQENFTSVEHLKRYTTLGMATDQGKTANISGLAIMANLLGKPIPEVGTLFIDHHIPQRPLVRLLVDHVIRTLGLSGKPKPYMGRRKGCRFC